MTTETNLIGKTFSTENSSLVWTVTGYEGEDALIAQYTVKNNRGITKSMPSWRVEGYLNDTFHLCVRIKSKWYTTATTNAGGCHAGADWVFEDLFDVKTIENYDLVSAVSVKWGSEIKKQKNYGGRLNRCPHFQLDEHAEDKSTARHFLRSYAAIFDSAEKAYKHLMDSWQERPEDIAVLKELKKEGYLLK